MLGDIDNLTIVRVGNVVSYSTLKWIGDRLSSAFQGIIRRVAVTHHESPISGSIDAYLLTMILNSEYRGHILGITDADLKTRDADEFYNVIIGGKNPRNDVAVVSTRKLCPDRIESDKDYELFVERTLKVALHEVGHNLGLTDHGHYAFATGGALCPMSKGEFNKFGYQGYVRVVIDGRGVTFCDDCDRFLKMMYGEVRAIH